MSRIRTFDNGKISAKFRTEQDAQDFDEFLESTISLVYNGEVLDTWKVKDRFDPYAHFGVERSSNNG